MSLGEVWWFLDTRADIDPAGAVASLARRGLSLAHPTSGQVSVLDDAGSRSYPNTDEVIAGWTARASVTAKLWLTPDTDVLFTVEEAGAVVTFDLDGLTLAEAEATVFAALAVAALSPATVGLVADSHLPETADFWRGYFAGTQDPPRTHADLLVTRGETPSTFRLAVGEDTWLRPG